MEWYDDDVCDSVEAKNAIATLDAFLRDEAEPVIADFEKKAEFPHALVSTMGDLGFFGTMIPEEYGGCGFGTKIGSLLARKIAYVSGGLHLIWTANSTLTVSPILHAGNDEQKRKLLPLLALGKKMGCFGLTEPEAGSDAGSLRMRAEKRGKAWVLNGSKRFITNALHASVGIFFARTGTGKHDISAFVIESDEPGFKDILGLTVKKTEKHIFACSDFCDVVFDDVVVRPEHGGLLGEFNQGFKIAMATLDGGRINIAAQSLGIASRIFDDALAYVKDREQFGKPIWDYQYIQFNFAEWHAKLLCLWLSIIRISNMRDDGKAPITPLASAVKLQATETAYEIAARAVRCFGGTVVTKDMDSLMRMLETCAATIYEGTSEMQKKVLAKYL